MARNVLEGARGREFVLGVDPGEDTGWGFLAGGRLFRAGLGGEWRKIKPLPGAGRSLAVVEHPTIYPRSRANPNDIVTLALCAGGIVEALRAAGWEVELVRPADWKGQVPKAVHHRRLRAALRLPEEWTPEGVPAGKAHNVLDGVGLALWGYEGVRR